MHSHHTMPFVAVVLVAVVSSSLLMTISAPGVTAFVPLHRQPFVVGGITHSVSMIQQLQQSHTRTSSSSSSSSRLSMVATAVQDATSDAIDRMAKSVESVLQNMGTIRTGRASPAMLDRVKADYYGVPTPISQMATIATPSAQQLTVDPFDKSQLGAIERAIIDADIGLTPQNDGNVIRLNVPDLTEDRRKEMMKQCKAIGEEGKVAIRNIRRSGVDAIKKLEKAGDISEDESKDGQDEIQKQTDEKVKEIDGIVSKKEKEVMTV